MNQLNQTQQSKRIKTLLTLSFLLVLPTLSSCSDFVDHPTPSEPAPHSEPTPPTEPSPTPNPANGPETDQQKNWRACEAERMWAFNSRLIDVSALRLYQQRNLAPVFNDAGVRQSGVEGWYECARALEMNGFTNAK
ncbi:MAG: hypothetical protein HYZ71_06830 [Deltaproteobacteria bacterium]|nr:hypothetical protein [Deltaproteobacteria bacterium]